MRIEGLSFKQEKGIVGEGDLSVVKEKRTVGEGGLSIILRLIVYEYQDQCHGDYHGHSDMVV